jgi:hypothetical protein
LVERNTLVFLKKGAIVSAHSPMQRSPWPFFALVFVLAAPLWLLGTITDRGLLVDLGINLPLSALIFVCPLLAAANLVYREEKLAGVMRLLQRIFDHRRIKPALWYAPILLLVPALYATLYGIMRRLGTSLPAPRPPC